MSGYCKCGAYHEEDDGRACAQCTDNAIDIEARQIFGKLAATHSGSGPKLMVLRGVARELGTLRAQVDKLTAENAKLSRTNERFMSFFEALADSMAVLNDRPAASDKDQIIETLLRTTSSLREHRTKVETLTAERDDARKDAVALALLAADAYSGLCYIQSSMVRDLEGYAKFYANGVGWSRVKDKHSNALPALTRHTPKEPT